MTAGKPEHARIPDARTSTGSPLRLSVIFTTYNAPRWLEKVFWGFVEQSYRHFDIIVADDGSTGETRRLIDRYRPEFESLGVELVHLWQPDEGFRKCRILNQAIVQAPNDYIVFTDGDCIPRRDFLGVHAGRAESGYFLSGSYYKLPMSTSERITREDVQAGRCFDRRWLRMHGLPAKASRLKLLAPSGLSQVLNHLTPATCNLKGANASAWRDDLVRVGGFDERMQWGGLDRELGVRLGNAGIQARHVRYDAVCVHLDHARGYRQADQVAANLALRRQVARERINRTAHGIDRLGPERR